MTKKLLLFVDTNIFLDFYRTEGDAGLSLLRHVESVADLLIMTDQVQMEFLKNRQRVIASALANIKPPTIPAFMPSYLADSKTAAALERNIDQVKKRIRVIKDRFARILKDPSRNDPVFRSFSRIVDNSFRNFNFASPDDKKRIFDLALQRHQRGFPPRKPDTNSMGDAINWEWILDTAKLMSSDVLIVSRDGDYGLVRDNAYHLNDWLFQEFKSRVSPKKKAELTPSISAALKRLDVRVTAAEEREEQNIIVQSLGRGTRLFPPFWPVVLKRMAEKAPKTCSNLMKAGEVLYGNDRIVISFPFYDIEFLQSLDTQGTRDLFQEIFKEMDYAPLKEVSFGGIPTDMLTLRDDIIECS